MALGTLYFQYCLEDKILKLCLSRYLENFCLGNYFVYASHYMGSECARFRVDMVTIAAQPVLFINPRSTEKSIFLEFSDFTGFRHLLLLHHLVHWLTFWLVVLVFGASRRRRYRRRHVCYLWFSFGLLYYNWFVFILCCFWRGWIPVNITIMKIFDRLYRKVKLVRRLNNDKWHSPTGTVPV